MTDLPFHPVTDWTPANLCAVETATGKVVTDWRCEGVKEMNARGEYKVEPLILGYWCWFEPDGSPYSPVNPYTLRNILSPEQLAAGCTVEWTDAGRAVLVEPKTETQPDALPEGVVEALRRAEMKLTAYVGVCKGDKELTEAVLPMVRKALAALNPKPPVDPLVEELRQWIATGFEQFAKDEPDFAISRRLSVRAAETILAQPWPETLKHGLTIKDAGK